MPIEEIFGEEDPTGLREQLEVERSLSENISNKNGWNDAHFRSWTEKAMTLMVGILIITIVALIILVGTLISITFNNRKAGYVSRAATCQLLVNTGATNLPSGCFDPHVKSLFSTKPGLPTSFRPDVENLLCQLAKKDGVSLPPDISC